jgi:hypothetical protein
MKFDSNQAWKLAAALVSANRDVLIALAGVFFLLPSLAFGLLLPQPQAQTGMNSVQMMAVMRGYYMAALPYVVPMLLLQATGTLAMLTLFTDRRRPTVGESIRRGVTGILPYIVAQVLLWIVIALVGVMAIAAAAMSGIIALAVIIGVAVVVAALYVAVKTSLVSPVIAVEGLRNPLGALARSWSLTKGNSVRVGLFYLLIIVGFGLLVIIVSLLTGIVIALLVKGSPALFAGEVIRAILGSVMTVYFIAVLAAVHRQLAGPSTESDRVVFE